MATPNKQPNTHISNFVGRLRCESTDPALPLTGDMYFDTVQNYLKYYNGSAWIGALFT